MSNTAVIVVEGVLKQPYSENAIASGLELYAGLISVMPIALISTNVGQYERTLQWVQRQGLTGWVTIIGTEDASVDRLSQISALRKRGVTGSVLLVDNDPIAVKSCYAKGVNCLLFCSPLYAEPHHRPDHEKRITPWNELVSEIDNQTTMYEGDQRLHPEV